MQVLVPSTPSPKVSLAVSSVCSRGPSPALSYAPAADGHFRGQANAPVPNNTLLDRLRMPAISMPAPRPNQACWLSPGTPLVSEIYPPRSRSAPARRWMSPTSDHLEGSPFPHAVRPVTESIMAHEVSEKQPTRSSSVGPSPARLRMLETVDEGRCGSPIAQAVWPVTESIPAQTEVSEWHAARSRSPGPSAACRMMLDTVDHREARLDSPIAQAMRRVMESRPSEPEAVVSDKHPRRSRSAPARHLFEGCLGSIPVEAEVSRRQLGSVSENSLNLRPPSLLVDGRHTTLAGMKHKPSQANDEEEIDLNRAPLSVRVGWIQRQADRHVGSTRFYFKDVEM